MLRVHFLQQWRSLSDLAMEEALFDVPLYREFAQLDAYRRLLDKSTILRFRHRLGKHKLAEGVLTSVNCLLSEQGLMLKEGSAVAARLIAAPSSTKNKDGKRKKLDKANIPIDALMDKIEKCKPVSGPRSSTRFASIKRQFGYVKVRYRDLKKNTLQLKTLFALFPPVDGTPPTDGRTGMSGLKNRTSASNRVEKVQPLSVHGIQKVWIESRRLLLNNIKPVTSLALSCSDLP